LKERFVCRGAFLVAEMGVGVEQVVEVVDVVDVFGQNGRGRVCLLFFPAAGMMVADFHGSEY